MRKPAAKPAPRKPANRPKPGAAARAVAAPSRGAPPVSQSKESSPYEYVLKLYVTGVTRASTLATERVRAVCEMHLPGRHRLEVIDIHQLPTLAREHQIVATPTLIRVLPPPLRRLIGSLASEEKILFGLDLRKK
jgi:circadian clock protein KaiB